MPKFCKRCNREYEKGEKPRDHVCDMMTLSDGRVVNSKRVLDPNGDVRKEIEEGKVKVEIRHKQEAAKPVGDRFILPPGYERNDK